MALADRWLYGWGLGYVAIGAASVLVPVYALALGAGPFLVGLVFAWYGLAGSGEVSVPESVIDR